MDEPDLVAVHDDGRRDAGQGTPTLAREHRAPEAGPRRVRGHDIRIRTYRVEDRSGGVRTRPPGAGETRGVVVGIDGGRGHQSSVRAVHGEAAERRRGVAGLVEERLKAGDEGLVRRAGVLGEKRLDLGPTGHERHTLAPRVHEALQGADLHLGDSLELIQRA